MKKILFLFAFFLPMIMIGQGVGIGTLTPDTSAILELRSNSKGLLIPRMDSLQRLDIAIPAEGLIVYDNDKQAICYFDGLTWKCLGVGGNGITGPQGPAGPVGATGAQGPAGNTGPAGVPGPQGPAGSQGIPGAQGVAGPQGTSGINGIHCWDSNGNGMNDPLEDTNGDGLHNSDDCTQGVTGPQGPVGATGPAGVAGPQGPIGATGPAGTPGQQGTAGINGIHCWDINGNGANDLSEDVNNDGQFNSADCIVTLPLGQTAITLETSVLTILDNATIGNAGNAKIISGLSTTITVAATDIVIINAWGIVRNNSNSTNSIAVAQVNIFIDGNIAGLGPSVASINEVVGTSNILNPLTPFNIFYTIMLPAGTHTIDVRGRKLPGTTATWEDSGVAGSLSVIKLKQ